MKRIDIAVARIGAGLMQSLIEIDKELDDLRQEKLQAEARRYGDLKIVAAIENSQVSTLRMYDAVYDSAKNFQLTYGVSPVKCWEALHRQTWPIKPIWGLMPTEEVEISDD